MKLAFSFLEDFASCNGCSSQQHIDTISLEDEPTQEVIGKRSPPLGSNNIFFISTSEEHVVDFHTRFKLLPLK